MAEQNTVDPTEELEQGIFSNRTAKRSRTAISKNTFLEGEEQFMHAQLLADVSNWRARP